MVAKELPCTQETAQWQHGYHRWLQNWRKDARYVGRIASHCFLPPVTSPVASCDLLKCTCTCLAFWWREAQNEARATTHMEPIVIDDVTDVIADVSRIFISWKRHELTSEGSSGIFLMSSRQLFLMGQKVSVLLYYYIFVGTSCQIIVFKISTLCVQMVRF